MTFYLLDCINITQSKQIFKNSVTRSNKLIRLIHINICESFGISPWSDEKYFIIFINYFSRYLYFLHEKSQTS